mgnify:FL=1
MAFEGITRAFASLSFLTFGLGTLSQQHVANMANSLCWVKTLRARTDTVHDAAATEQRKRIVELSETLHGRGIACIGNKTPRLQQGRWTEELFWVPPE